MADHAARNMPDRPTVVPQPVSPRGVARPALARTASGLNAQPRVIALKALGARLSGQAPGGAIQREAVAAPNRTGLPDQLKQGVEALSGVAMDDVRVHRNSARPAQLQAHAFAQGSDIHLAPGQEQHLPHEAWHVVQQKQGRVRATAQLKAGEALNDDRGLEREADMMGARALGTAPAQGPLVQAAELSGNAPVQCQLWKWVRPMMGKPYWEQVGNNSNIRRRRMRARSKASSMTTRAIARTPTTRSRHSCPAAIASWASGRWTSSCWARHPHPATFA